MDIDKEKISSNLKEMFSRGAKASKKAFEKAGDKVQDFTDKSVLKLEKHQLETKRDCKYEELGLKLSQMLAEGAVVSSQNTEDIEILNNIQEEIINLSDKIREKENLL